MRRKLSFSASVGFVLFVRGPGAWRPAADFSRLTDSLLYSSTAPIIGQFCGTIQDKVEFGCPICFAYRRALAHTPVGQGALHCRLLINVDCLQWTKREGMTRDDIGTHGGTRTRVSQGELRCLHGRCPSRLSHRVKNYRKYLKQFKSTYQNLSWLS